MFSDVPEARVFLYSFKRPDNLKAYGITKYANDLLKELVEGGLGERFIHFVGHSTGGLVVKRALVLANGTNEATYLAIKRQCCGITFFGTPRKSCDFLRLMYLPDVA